MIQVVRNAGDAFAEFDFTDEFRMYFAHEPADGGNIVEALVV